MGLNLDPKIVLVTRKTRLEELTERFNTRAQAKFYVGHARASWQVQEMARRERDPGKARLQAPTRAAVMDAAQEFSDYEQEHETYRRSFEQVRADLELGLKVQVIDRSLVPTYLFGPRDVVVTIGQDGLVANTAKYALNLPIVGVNPDPQRFDGVLLPFGVQEARQAVQQVLAGRARLRRVTLAEARLNDGQRLLGFNDLFIGNRTHVSARYRIEAGAAAEPQSSSGILVSTGAGSTGWLSSVFNMAAGLGSLMQGAPRPRPPKLAWEDPRLVYVVREPFLSRHSRASIVAGVIQQQREVTVESLMPQNGVIFSDGVESDFLAFNSGMIATVRAADEHAMLVVR